jgi:hypothetical protein
MSGNFSNNDFHNNVKAIRMLSPVAAGTTGTGKTSSILDRAGYGGVEIVFDYGTVTATNATYTVTLLEGDVTGTLTSVADADMLGTEVLAGVAAAATRTSGVSKNVSKRLGYKGAKRYLQAKVVNTVTATTPIAVTALLFNPSVAPVSNP